MAGTAIDTQRIGSRFFIDTYDHDPGGTSATVVSPDGGTTKYILDMRDYRGVLYHAETSVSASSSGMTKLEIVAYEDSAGAGTAYVVKETTGTADAVGDILRAECTAAEIAQVGGENDKSLRYVTARITCSNAGDEARVAVVAEASRAYGDLSADTNIS
jgi:hypothetical protein